MRSKKIYKSNFKIKNRKKATGLKALYLYYCYLLKVFPKQKYPPKYSKAMKEEIKKMDDYSNSARFLAKYNITTLAEIKEYKFLALVPFQHLHQINFQHYKYAEFSNI